MTKPGPAPYDPDTAKADPAEHAALAHWLVRRFFRTSWTHYDDLVQDALEAFTRAARTYDPSRGRWTTYALRAAIRELRPRAMGYRLPGTTTDAMRRLLAPLSRAVYLGAPLEEALAATDLDAEDTAAARFMVEDLLDPTAGDASPSGDTRLDRMADEAQDTAQDYERAARDAEVRRRVATLAAVLTPRELLVLEHLERDARDEHETLAELGHRIGRAEGGEPLTRQRAEQLRNRLLAKLRHHLADLAPPCSP